MVGWIFLVGRKTNYRHALTHIILTRVGLCRFQQRTAQVENWQCKVVWQDKVHSFHFCFAQYTFCSYLLVLFCHVLLWG